MAPCTSPTRDFLEARCGCGAEKESVWPKSRISSEIARLWGLSCAVRVKLLTKQSQITCRIGLPFVNQEMDRQLAVHFAFWGVVTLVGCAKLSPFFSS